MVMKALLAALLHLDNDQCIDKAASQMVTSLHRNKNYIALQGCRVSRDTLNAWPVITALYSKEE